MNIASNVILIYYFFYQMNAMAHLYYMSLDSVQDAHPQAIEASTTIWDFTTNSLCAVG